METDFGSLTVRQPPTWEEGTLAIRPERIHVCAQKPASNGLRARVIEAIYRGSHLELLVQCGANPGEAASGVAALADSAALRTDSGAKMRAWLLRTHAGRPKVWPLTGGAALVVDRHSVPQLAHLQTTARVLARTDGTRATFDRVRGRTSRGWERTWKCSIERRGDRFGWRRGR